MRKTSFPKDPFFPIPKVKFVCTNPLDYVSVGLLGSRQQGNPESAPKSALKSALRNRGARGSALPVILTERERHRERERNREREREIDRERERKRERERERQRERERETERERERETERERERERRETATESCANVGPWRAYAVSAIKNGLDG